MTVIEQVHSYHSDRFFYYVHYPNDSSYMKTAVAVLWAFNTVHETLCISGGYSYFMAGWVNPASIVIVTSEIVVQLLFTALVAVPTQSYFVYRIYIFSGKNILAPLLYFPMGLIQFGKALSFVLGLKSDRFFEHISDRFQ
ncbi:hypothetical protein J3R82DRAFT_2618 [Butyriboletus roseoflavus]|nr:hypothetical protein J3R82DRAFT_2618 [Butyriboletus roseoflavus]